VTKFQKILLGITGLLFALIVVGMVFYIGSTNLSSKENVLLNILLAVFSGFLSLIISQYYFDSSRASSIEEIKKEYQSNLKIYAQKAAEKVSNLSSELTKLSIYLQQDEAQQDDPRITLLIEKEKVRSSIHIIQTLKSVNDRSLSDWRGVIPENEIEEQDEVREEREGEFRQLLNNYREILHEQSERFTGEPETDEAIHHEISDINDKIDKLATSIIGTPLKDGFEIQPKKVRVVGTCPVCTHEIVYRQRPAVNSVKKQKCPECETKLLSRWNPKDGFTLEIKSVQQSGNTTGKIIDESIIGLVQKELPPQPWPKGIAKEVGKRLGLSQSDMKRAINELIARGIFKVQINGVLFNAEISPTNEQNRKIKPKLNKSSAAGDDVASSSVA